MSHTTAATSTARVDNAAVITAIRNHHAELADALHQHTDAVLRAARGGDYAQARQSLHTWYQTQLLPHIQAEEQALYSTGAEMERTQLLVRGMLAEHRDLVGRIGELALALDALDLAALAVSARALFDSHLGKENDLLLPALDAAGVDLAAALEGMHEVLGHGAHGEASGHDEGAGTDSCGCGCGCSHDASPADTAAQSLPDPAVRPDDELDVRTLPHGSRHEIIFAKLDALAVGDTLVIVNDHDPKPLRYQVSAMWPDCFYWRYLNSGPQLWRLAITRAQP